MTACENVAWGHELKSAASSGALAALFPVSRGEQLGRLVSQDLVLGSALAQLHTAAFPLQLLQACVSCNRCAWHHDHGSITGNCTGFISV